ncbi:MAG: hypothetical protein JXB05_31435 [Myxococcaceae bacterium]|nr:hypothetical protein [Myxococcaceae bacterium]
MNRTIRIATLLGGLSLGVGCASEEIAPAESDFFPAPQIVQAQPKTTMISGYAWDPEAFFMNLAFCGGPACPIPPFLLDTSPLYLRAAVQGATILPFDPVLGAPAAEPVVANDSGLWTLPSVPSRDNPPYFLTALPTGSLTTAPIGPPLPAIPQGGYVPTVTLRPVVTHNSVCAAMEAGGLSTVGILEAVAKHLTVAGTPTTVQDLTTPARYANVLVFWLFQPGSPLLRVPAGGTTIEASAGQVLHIDWAPPGVPPPELRSTRGFIVTDAESSPLGISVVLLPAGADVPPVVRYSFIDTQTDEALSRPWWFPPIEAPPVPGLVNFSGTQLWRSDEPNGPPGPPPPWLCLPQ